MLNARNGFKVGLVSLKTGDNCVPIGLVMLGTYLKKHGIKVEIIDANYVNPLERIQNFNYDLIGISAMTVHYGRALRLADRVKGIKGIPVVVGGVHISTLPQSLKPCFDHAVIGEGEQALLEICNSYMNKKPPDRIISGKPIQNLDSLPLPDWGLVDKRYFRNGASTTFGEFGIEGSILTSRGCPYKCRFCSTTKFWDKLRFHSAEYVVDMISDLVDNYHANLIQIWDDLFTVNIQRLVKIKEKIPKVKFNCQPRPNLVTDELCKLLKEIGVTIGIFGFESGSDKVLGYLKHNTVTVNDNKNAIECFKRNGLQVQGSVVLGSPGETIEDMYKTLDFVEYCIKQKVQRLWAFVLTPFPATEIWEVAKQRGKVNDNYDWDRLACQNYDEPLLLDDSVDIKEFKRVYNKILDRITSMRWNKVRSFLFHNPLETTLYALQQPKYVLQQLVTRNDV
jgi:anaerobic magnesium-protoporphyrin IX monomethyl ester cyclase